MYPYIPSWIEIHPDLLPGGKQITDRRMDGWMDVMNAGMPSELKAYWFRGKSVALSLVLLVLHNCTSLFTNEILMSNSDFRIQ